jgi:outer membrane protein assembly factor BamB
MNDIRSVFTGRALAAAVAVVFAAAPAFGGEDPRTGPAHWPTFRNGPQNRGESPVRLDDAASAAGQAGRSPFVSRTGGLIWGTAVVDGAGHVYVGSADKTFYSFDKDGRERWRYRLFDRADALVDSAAALTPDGLVVVPGGDGFLHGLDARTGDRRWVFDPSAGSEDRHRRGAVVNSFEGNVQVGPDGNLYAGSDNGNFYSLDPAGRERWQFATRMMIWSSPAFDPANRWLAFGSLDGRVYLLDPATGRLLASYAAGAEVKSSPATDGAGRLYFGDSDGRLHAVAVDTSAGFSLRRLWTLSTGGEVYSSPAIRADRIYFGSLDGNLYCVSPDGRQEWAFDTRSRISSSPVVTADGRVVFGAKNGKLYVLDAASGERLWSFRSGEARIRNNLDASPAIGPDGTIYVGSYDGSIHAIPPGFAQRVPSDPRIERGGRRDQPEHGPPLAADGATLRFQDRLGRLHAAPPGTLGLAESLRLALVVRAGGDYASDRALNPGGLEVNISPAVPLASRISADGKTLNVSPEGFFEPRTRYRLTVKGWHRKKGGNWLLDRFFGWERDRLEAAVEFETEAAPGFETATEADTAWAIRDLFLFQPEALETYTPAALAGQAFVIAAAGGRLDSFAMVGMPALPTPGGVTVLAEPSKVFALAARRRGAWLKGEGQFGLAAMGGELTFDPFAFAAKATPEGGLSGGAFIASAPLLRIRGSGQGYSFPASLLNDVADHGLNLVAVGTFEGSPFKPEKAAPALSLPPELSGDRVMIRLAAPAEGEHLLVVATVSRDDGRPTGLGAVRTRSGEATFTVPLAARADERPGAGDWLALYWDGMRME